MQVYSKAVVLPPKVYYYEPQLFGFRVAGKRGSTFFKPERSEITDTLQRQKRLDAELSAGTQTSGVRNNSSQ